MVAPPLQAQDALLVARVCGRRRPSLSSLGRRFLGFAVGFGGCLGVGDTLQMMTNFFSNFDGDRAGMCFFLGYAETRQKVNNGFGLHLELTGEFIDTDLGCVTHTALGVFLFLLFRRGVSRCFSRRRVRLRGGFLGLGLCRFFAAGSCFGRLFRVSFGFFGGIFRSFGYLFRCGLCLFGVVFRGFSFCTFGSCRVPSGCAAAAPASPPPS